MNAPFLTGWGGGYRWSFVDGPSINIPSYDSLVGILDRTRTENIIFPHTPIFMAPSNQRKTTVTTSMKLLLNGLQNYHTKVEILKLQSGFTDL